MLELSTSQEIYRYFIRYLMLSASVLFLFHFLSSVLHHFIHCTKGAFTNAAMCFFTALYCLSIFFTTFSFTQEIADYFIPLNFIAGFAAYFFYSQTVGHYLKIKSRLYKIGQTLIMLTVVIHTFNAIYFLLMGNSLLASYTTSIDSSWYYLICHLTQMPNLIGQLVGVIGGTGIIITIPIILKKLLPKIKSERLLFAGVCATLIVSCHDTALGLNMIKYGVPLYFVGNILEMIRFSTHFQNEAKRKIAALEYDLSRITSMAQTSILAGSILHDIRSPLTILKLLGEKVRKTNLRDHINNDNLDSIATNIEINTNRMNDVINGYASLLNKLKCSPLIYAPVKSLISEAIGLSFKKIKDTDVEVDIKKTGGFHLHCRETEVTLVIVNLISNSCDAIRECEKKWIEIRSYSDEDNNYISITDSGKGIPEDIVDKVFDYNFTTKSHGLGTGFGLGIVKTILDSYGFTIFVDQKCIHTRFVIKISKG